MENVYEMLKKHIYKHQPNFGDGESVLALLYEAYSECNRLDDFQIKSDFDELYCMMNGMPLRDIDKIIYPVCKLCRNHERSAFIHGVMIGVKLAEELRKV